MFNRLVRASLLLLSAASLALAGCGSGLSTAVVSGPLLTFSPSPATFASTFTGVTSASQTVTITNVGTSPATFTSLTTSGDFGIVANGTICVSGLTLPANNYCTLLLTFTPTALGARTGALTVASTAPASPQNLALSGTGAQGTPVLTLAPTSLTFATTTVGQSTATQLITATNTGTAPLTLSNIAASLADFTFTSNGCGSALAINASCTVSVGFTPTATGTRSGSLVFTSNASASPQSVAFSGVAQAAGNYAGPALTVTVKAGTALVSGAAVQLYAAGSSGNGSAPTPLLGLPATSSAAGIASIATGYNCPSAAALLYAVSKGGTVAGASSPNSNLQLLSALGPCGNLSSGSKFVIDEATTVASMEALAPFYAAGGNIGASSTNTVGLTNAFATAALLADPVAGTSPGASLPANVASPAARINSLANLLNTCSAASSACAAFYAAAANGATPATNQQDALYQIIRAPGANVAALYTLAQPTLTFTPPYTPALTTVPADWTMFLTISGGGMSEPAGLGVDSKGNVWVGSYNGIASKFTPLGAPVFASGITGDGLNNAYGLAIDLNDNVWIPNEGPGTSRGIGSVTELSSTGALIGNYISGGLNFPLSIALDPNGTTWVVDYGNSSLTLLNSSGAPLSGSNGYTSADFAFPVAVAVDGNHFGWLANLASGNVTKVAPDGSTFTNFACCNQSAGLAIDQNNFVWVANYYGDSISLLTNAGQTILNGLTAPSIYHPQGIAVDGAGSLWISSYRRPFLVELAGASTSVPGALLTPAAGLGADASLLDVYSLALDSTGSIWVSNYGSNTITRFIGLAVPVKTPLSGIPKLP